MSKNTSKSLNMLKKFILLPGKIISCFKIDDEKYIIIPTPQSSASKLNFIDEDFITAPTPHNSEVDIKFTEDKVSKTIYIASWKLANQKNSNFDHTSKYVSKNVHFAPEPLLTTMIKPKAITEATTVENELFEYVYGDELNDSQLLKNTDDELELLTKEILGNMEKLIL